MLRAVVCTSVSRLAMAKRDVGAMRPALETRLPIAAVFYGDSWPANGRTILPTYSATVAALTLCGTLLTPASATGIEYECTIRIANIAV